MSTVANFATGQGNYDATLYGGPTLDSSANVGTGDLSLNAVASQYMASTTTWTPPAVTPGNGISFSGWFYPASYGGSTYQSAGATLFDISGLSTSVSMYCDGTGKLIGNFNGNVVTCPVVVQNNLGATTYGANNGWHFFCYTIYCTAAGTALQSIYLDASCAPGLNQATTINTTTYVQITSGGNNYIGYGKGQGAPTWAYFNGKIDDFRFYNRVLTPPEISVLYQYNYKSNTTPTIAAQLVYDVSYSNAVQIDVSGTFSGLDVSRNPAFSAAQLAGGSSMKVSAASLQLVGDSTWAYVDTTVAPDTSYSYTIKPYIMNTYGSTTTALGSITTTPVLNGFFNQATTLPGSGLSSLATTAVVGGWTFNTLSGTSTNTLCNGSVAGYYTGTLPSTVTYYMDVSQSTISSVQMYQNIGIYTGTTGFVSFYMWPKDASYNASQTVTVTLGGITLLNSYAFATSTANAVPYTSFNLPFSMTRAGTYPLTFTFSNSAANLSGVNVSGIQVRMQDTTALGIGYKTIDPSNLALYYNFDTSFSSATAGAFSLYDSSNGTAYGLTTLDASMVGGATISASNPASLMGVNSLYLPGGSSYAQIAKWTLGAAAVGAGFSVCGWVYRSAASPASVGFASTVESSNATIATFGTVDGSCVSIFLNQRTGCLDFSCNVTNGPEFIATQTPVQPQMWNFFAMTCACTSATASASQCVYNFYQNDVLLQSMPGAWPNRSSVNPMTFVNNFLGGVPAGTVISANLAGNLKDLSGNLDDFRVYNRALSKGDIDALWSYGFALNQYANLIDPTGLGMYYPMDPGSDLLYLPSGITMGTTTGIGSNAFTLNWTGGVGTGVSYSFGITQGGVAFTSFAASGVTSTSATITGTGAGFTIGLPYVVTVYASSAGGSVSASTTVTPINPIPFVINSAITGWNSANDVSGTSVTNSITYKVYAFKPVLAAGATSASYTLTYNCTSASYIYVLAVGGGGSGGGYTSGGGGAGGVVMMPIYITSGSSTIGISVGGGGATASGNAVNGANGMPSTVTFNFNTNLNIYAGGGNGGSANTTTSPAATGSSGGNSGYNGSSPLTYTNRNVSNNYNYTNFGGGGYIGSSETGGGGGGGAGTSGITGSISTGDIGGNGGDGIQCFLPGIKDFTPTGYSTFGLYYWGGGGGAAGTSGGLGRSGTGGLGGGGGAGGAGVFSIGGLGGISMGITGISSGNGGAGGANTGGGGGATWTSTSGAGGSGIVVIAFPQNSGGIPTNALAVLPTTLYNSGNYRDVLSYDSFNGTKTPLLSAAAYSSVKGAFSCKLINYNYFGPIMTLRHSLDTTGIYTTNFYADVCGNMGTGYLGTGQSLNSWLTSAGANTTYAFVTKWYNQGMDVCFNCATQYTMLSQPIYDVTAGSINFGIVGSTTIGTAPTFSSFNLPVNSIPGNAGNSISYTYGFNTLGIGSVNSPVLFGGANNSGAVKNIGCYLFQNNQLQPYFNDYSPYTGASVFSGQTVASFIYNSSTGTYGTEYIYKNGTSYSSDYPYALTSATTSQTLTYCYFGKHPGYSGDRSGDQAKFQLQYIMMFNSAYSSNDRTLVEATPYTYTAPASMTLTIGTTTATTFVLSTSTVTNAAYFVVYVNGSVTSTISAATSLSSVTVTPVSSGPWAINVYAYNATYGLLAGGYTLQQYIPPPLVYYTFDTTSVDANKNILNSATGIYDASINNASNSTTLTTTGGSPVSGGYLSLDGTGCVTRRTPITVGTAGFSFAAWIKWNSNTNSNSATFEIGSISLNSSTTPLFLFRNYYSEINDTGVSFFGNDSNGNGSNSTNTVAAPTTYTIATGTAPPAAKDGIWRHWAITMNSSGNWICYLNGNATPLKSGFTNYPFTAAVSPIGLTFGGYLLSTSTMAIDSARSIIGGVDDFRLYNYVLTPTQIAILYSKTSSGI